MIIDLADRTPAQKQGLLSQLCLADATGRFVTPGCIDEHTHFSSAGALLIGANLLDVSTSAGLASRVKVAVGRMSPGAWLTGGAFAMGAGIWSMHFVAMLAYQIPVPVKYELWTTLASMVAAIITSGFALAM